MAECGSSREDFDPDNLSLSEVDANESDETVRYYHSLLPYLKNVPLSDVCEDLIQTIAFFFNYTSTYDTDWELICGDMLGAAARPHTAILAKIQGVADSKNQLPLYVALRGPLRHRRTLGHIVESLLKRQQMHVLIEIRPFIEEYVGLKKKDSSEFEQCAEPTSNDVKNGNPISPSCPAYEESFQKNCSSEVPVWNIPVENCITRSSRSELSAFIIHTFEETSLMRRWQTIFKESYNIDSTLLCDIEDVLQMGNEVEVLSARLRTVDFLLPSLSREYLSQISLKTNTRGQSDYERWNHLIYDWMLSDFSDHGAINCHIKPIVGHGVDLDYVLRFVEQRKIRFFRYLYQIPDDLPKLVNSMQSTKRKFPRFCTHF